MAPLQWMERNLLIQDAIENQQIKGGPSNRIGASSLGDYCKRQIWYKWRNVKQSFLAPRMKRLFARGSQEEKVVYKDLEAVGVQILEKQGFIEFCHGYAAGMHDGIILGVHDAPKTKHLLEIKTGNQKAYNALKSKGLVEGKPEHYMQMQIYMKLFKLTRGLYIFTHKDTDNRHYERVRYSPQVAEEGEAIAEMVVFSEGPPARVHDNPDKFPCAWCSFVEVCHFGKPPQVNCRTCQHVNLLGEGKWGCGIRDDKELDFKKQCKGCKKWKINIQL